MNTQVSLREEVIKNVNKATRPCVLGQELPTQEQRQNVFCWAPQDYRRQVHSWLADAF